MTIKTTFDFSLRNNTAPVTGDEPDNEPDNEIDYDFIIGEERDPEGGYSGKAFVPTDRFGAALGKSGITFAGGLDIGQIGASELQDLCSEDSRLYDILRPYIGIIGKPAQDLLRALPLEITPAEVQFLTHRKYRTIHQRLKRLYGAEKFHNLPAEARTILLSVAVQYGADLPRRTPRFWRHAERRDWQAMVRELRDFGDNYNSRRCREADYLAAALAVNNG